jgi:hypothetical protein
MPLNVDSIRRILAELPAERPIVLVSGPDKPNRPIVGYSNSEGQFQLYASPEKQNESEPIWWGSDALWAILKPSWRFLTITGAGEPLAHQHMPNGWRQGCWESPGLIRSLCMLDIQGLPDTQDWHKASSVLQRPVRWQCPDENTPVDTPVWARHHTKASWSRWCWAGNGRCYADGHCAWTAKNQDDSTVACAFVVLADKDDPDRAPPTDLLIPPLTQ